MSRHSDIRRQSARAAHPLSFFHFGKQFAHAVRVGCFGPGIARRMHARRAAERRNYQSGIVREHRLAL